MATYPEHCKQVVYPMFKGLYGIKRGDKLEQVKNTMLYYIVPYVADLDADIIGLELKAVCKTVFNVVNNHNIRITRKQLDILLTDLLTKIGMMLKANNAEFPGKGIHNTVGRISHHYSYKVI